MESTFLPPLPIDADLLCGQCSQNLRGVISDRCPECGTHFDRARLVSPSIPWEQRRQLGRFRAYWKTVRLFTFPGKISTEAMQAVTLRAARSFRRWTLLLLCAAVFVPIMVWKMNEGGSTPRPRTLFPLFYPESEWPKLPELLRNPWFFGTSLVSLLIWVIAATGISSYFFHPRRLAPAQQKRAVALSDYAMAPLGWILPLMLGAALFIGIEVSYEYVPWIYYSFSAVFATLLILCALCPVTYFWTTLRLLRQATASRLRVLTAALLLPILWTLLAGGIFLGLQFAVNYVALFCASLR